ncbi:hypothetical protein [Rhodococcus wratislaviensis]|uniref:hypothetical protein n=1 Tax=Rhodococcus wratislaviensis TaxID=44752 RepID=UPI0035117F6A
MVEEVVVEEFVEHLEASSALNLSGISVDDSLRGFAQVGGLHRIFRSCVVGRVQIPDVRGD